jgi:hypothetical protein
MVAMRRPHLVVANARPVTIAGGDDYNRRRRYPYAMRPVMIYMPMAMPPAMRIGISYHTKTKYGEQYANDQCFLFHLPRVW